MSATCQTSTEMVRLYKSTNDVNVRNQIVLMNSNLIKMTALSMRNLYLKFAEVDDVINECVIALIGAIESFDINRDIKFESWAALRIKGAIIDFIRKQDFIPRSVRQFSKNFESTYSLLYSELKREPTNKELADKMGMDEDKCLKLLADSAVCATLSFEELLYNNSFDLKDTESQADINIYKSELNSKLSQAVLKLSEKEKNVINLYYYEKLRFSDIAKVLGVSESRVCQIHSKAVVRLRMYLTDYFSL